jgi:hypothetical protein
MIYLVFKADLLVLQSGSYCKVLPDIVPIAHAKRHVRSLINLVRSKTQIYIPFVKHINMFTTVALPSDD